LFTFVNECLIVELRGVEYDIAHAVEVVAILDHLLRREQIGQLGIDLEAWRSIGRPCIRMRDNRALTRPLKLFRGERRFARRRR